MNDWRRRAAKGLKTGDEFAFSRTFAGADVHAFGGITRDMNAVHSDAPFATMKGFAGTICHGLLVGSMVTEIGGQISWLATRMDFEFLRPVHPGDTVTCRMRIDSVDERRFAIATAILTNQDGLDVMRVRLEGFLPSTPERARLAELAGRGSV
ncbi:MAG: MaoC family dehydratase N-terminal domain-containing protein [Deltaproteobacteria bacterium]|nr:MaoC family dehydratase N-terminal domain-containing protein [Deltaproteobacteria bacterium]